MAEPRTPRADIDQDARWQIAEWVRFCRERFRQQYPDDADFAKKLHLSAPTVSLYLSGKRPAGLEALLRLRAFFNVDAEKVLIGPPPWHEIGRERPPDPRGLPRHRAPSRAHSTKRGAADSH